MKLTSAVRGQKCNQSELIDKRVGGAHDLTVGRYPGADYEAPLLVADDIRHHQVVPSLVAEPVPEPLRHPQAGDVALPLRSTGTQNGVGSGTIEADQVIQRLIACADNGHQGGFTAYGQQRRSRDRARLVGAYPTREVALVELAQEAPSSDVGEASSQVGVKRECRLLGPTSEDE
jgi:hypothetical protein